MEEAGGSDRGRHVRAEPIPVFGGAPLVPRGLLTLRVLGELDAVRDGTRIELGGRRQRAALAALIIARGDVVSDERLAECVWGDGAAGRGTGGLQSYVSHLRRMLQPDSGARSRTDVIIRIGRGYALAPTALDVDSWRFERVLEAMAELPASERVRELGAVLDLWRGPAYAEYADEPWALDVPGTFWDSQARFCTTTWTGTVLPLLTVPRIWQQQTLGSRTKLLSTTVGN